MNMFAVSIMIYLIKFIDAYNKQINIIIIRILIKEYFESNIKIKIIRNTAHHIKIDNWIIM